MQEGDQKENSEEDSVDKDTGVDDGAECSSPDEDDDDGEEMCDTCLQERLEVESISIIPK